MCSFSCMPLEYWPVMPAAELTQINKADTAAASFAFPQFNKSIIGLSIIPPPMPISPEKKPINAPVTTAIEVFTGFVVWDSFPIIFIIFKIANRSSMPKMIL